VLSGVYGVSPAGDFNGDGRDDWLASTVRQRHPGGAAFIILDTPAAREVDVDEDKLSAITINGASPNSVLIEGTAAGDVNGDGLDDIVLAVPTADNNRRGDSGSAYVVFGRESRDPVDLRSFDLGIQGDSGYRIDGAASGDFAGQSVSAVEDLNGDGLNDVIVSAFYGGATYLVPGKSDSLPVDLAMYELGMNEGGFRIDHPVPDYNSYVYASRLGDVNGDQSEDFGIGLVGGDTEYGRVYVIYGTASTESLNARRLPQGRGFVIREARLGDRFGEDLAPAGRFNNDGFDDFVVGAPGNDSGTSGGKGRTYVIYGAPSRRRVDVRKLGRRGVVVKGPRGGTDFGYAVADAGDVNGDGRGDILVGAPRHRPIGRNHAGSAWLIYGQSSWRRSIAVEENRRVAFGIYGRRHGDWAGYSVAATDSGRGGRVRVLVGAVGAFNGDGSVHFLKPRSRVRSSD
jgi:hypothetical protein